jgi:adenine-specific DNA-methyltransferase
VDAALIGRGETMASPKTKLELTWIGKDNRPKLEPRILIEDKGLSYHAKQRVTDHDRFDNLLIQGDNLLALKALEQEYAGKVKCVYIDPPYNTKSAIPDYEDGIERSLWLSLMRERLQVLWRLLVSDNGTLLISINDDEGHYLKVLCDELFGVSSFVASLVWNYEGNTDNTAKIINYHEYVLVYSKTGDVDDPEVFDPSISKSSKLFRDEIRNTIVKNGPKNPPKTVLIPSGFPASFESGTVKSSDVRYPEYSSDIVVKGGRTTNEVRATTGWSSREILESFIQNGCRPVRDSKGQDTTFELKPTGAIEAIKVRVQTKGHFVSVLRGFGTTNQMRLLLEKIGVKFSYPKPVNLISYLLSAFSGDDDLVLDSFAGSGTTGHAVMKLNLETGSRRRYILVELSPDTMSNVTLPRLRAVIDGSAAAEIPSHGGGFRFYRLAPSLLEKDKWGNWVVSKQYNSHQLAEAMCKLHGFRFEPSSTIFWQHGRSTENDYLYCTTQTLVHDQLAGLSADVGPERTLLVVCRAFRSRPDAFPNLTLKKIPASVLSACEWGKDDYSLNVANIMREEPSPEPAGPARATKVTRAKPNPAQGDLFGNGAKK